MSQFLNITPAAGDPARWIIAGEIDVDTAPIVIEELGRHLPAPDGATVRVSCARVEFIDVAGLHALWRARRLAAERGVTIDIVEPSPSFRLLLDLVAAHDPRTVADVNGRTDGRLV